MPEKGETVKFQNYHKQLPAPFVTYADFEAITEVSGCTPNNSGSYTEAYQKHIDCFHAHKIVCCYGDKFTKSIKSYGGENAVYKFLEEMLKEVWHCKKCNQETFQ